MNLVIDVGNTRVKAGLYEGARCRKRLDTGQFSAAWLEGFAAGADVDKALVSASGALPEALTDWLKARCPWQLLDHHTPLPFQNAYRTPETLGRDRLAAAAGALALGMALPLLVIDAGTCITADILDRSNRFLGGSIAPGIAMRARAMATFTHRLPEVPPDDRIELPGRDTRGSLQAGAFLGAVCELEGLIARYRARYRKLNVVITGGDAPGLASRIKYSIFVSPDLVLEGLNLILNQHAEQG
jgi:type III pantothenate kinase